MFYPILSFPNSSLTKSLMSSDEPLQLVIFSYILVTLMVDSEVILTGEIKLQDHYFFRQIFFLLHHV